MLALLLVTDVLASEPPQRVRLELVAGQALSPGAQVLAATTWLGEDRDTPLRDDGLAPDSRGGDGTWTAEWTGEPVRFLTIQLTATPPGGEKTELFAATEPIALGEERLVWALDPAGAGIRARRVAGAVPMRGMELSDTLGIAAGFGWLAAVLGYVGWLLRHASREERP
jgi:hypothetical protein